MTRTRLTLGAGGVVTSLGLVIMAIGACSCGATEESSTILDAG